MNKPITIIPTPQLPAFIITVVCIAAMSQGSWAQESTDISDADRSFYEEVEPILKSHCFGCHSHEAGEMEGGLTLDSRSGWAEGGGRGPAIVPGNPEESLLIRAVRRADSDFSMPPEEPLPDEAIESLVNWIRRGAPDPRTNAVTTRPDRNPLDWWSLRPLNRPAIPTSDEQDRETINPIDAFVNQRLQAEGISPAPPADRRTLIRRLYFDLHGLPPTPDDVAAFEADTDPLAWENLVDRLLQSERYGERWARHWLDTVHFADSHGCEHDVFRPNAWRYRDYVIDSFNRDTSWARLIREQLAADVFFPEEPHLMAALGFVAAGPLELSRAGTAPVTFDYLDRDDMVAQTMAAFTSSTANCARCHDHKFDPITQDDYYALQAVFAGAGKGDIEFDIDPVVAKERRQWQLVLAAAATEDAALLSAPEFAEIVEAWEAALGSEAAAWEPLMPATFLSSDGTTLQRLDDNSLLATGERPETDTYTITASPSLARLTALRLDVLADDGLPMQGPGRQDNGNLHLSEFEATAFVAGETEARILRFRKATADFDQAGWTIAHAIDGDPTTAWGIHPEVGKSHFAVFELEVPLDLAPGSHLVVLLKQLHGKSHLIGRPKLYATDAPGAAAELLPESVRLALQIPSGQRTEAQRIAVAGHALRLHAEQQLAALPAPSAVYGVSSGYSHGKKLEQPIPPKTVHVLRRGDIEQPGAIAVPGALSAITALKGRFQLDDLNNEAARRAALADWIAAKDNPLTWRSAVNRVWSFHFGRGLCETPNDFGRMGGQPSHPELLDWLAIWFRDDAGGSLKELHRTILLSSTYQRASRIGVPIDSVVGQKRPEQIDAANRLLWRANRRRLDAESFRDAILQISGRIDLSMGGPGVQQFAQLPGFQLTPTLDYDAFDWSAPTAARRSIYRVVWRGIADPFMESLDFPDLGLLAPNRGSSVSSLQALTLLNNDFVLHHSRQLSKQLVASQPAIDDQVAEACRLIWLREPHDEEQAALVAYAQQHGLAALCRVLFNSNEFAFVD